MLERHHRLLVSFVDGVGVMACIENRMANIDQKMSVGQLRFLVFYPVELLDVTTIFCQ
jgi:hypothetical protein